MHITSRHEHLAELFGEVCHLQIDGNEVIICLDIGEIGTALEEVIIVNGLDFQIIIERSNF